MSEETSIAYKMQLIRKARKMRLKIDGITFLLRFPNRMTEKQVEYYERYISNVEKKKEENKK